MFLLLVTFFATLITDASDLREEDPAEEGPQERQAASRTSSTGPRSVGATRRPRPECAIFDALLVVTVLPAPPGRMPDGSRFDLHSIDTAGAS